MYYVMTSDKKSCWIKRFKRNGLYFHLYILISKMKGLKVESGKYKKI